MAAADLTAARKRKRIHYDDVMMWACGLLFAAAISLLVWTCWAIWSGSRRPTFELKRDDWTCSKTEPISQLQLVGKVLVPMTINVCVEYERKQ